MKNNNNQLLMTLLKGRTFIVLILLIIFFSIASPSFLQVSTLTMVAKHVSLYGILALGMTFVIITGGIDLSVGSVVGLVGMLTGALIQQGLSVGNKTIYFSVPAIIVLMLLFGCLVGLINGLIITKLKVAAFITTLGTMYVCRGMANLTSNGATFSNIGGYEGLGNTGIKTLGNNWFGIPAGIYVFAVLVVCHPFCLNGHTSAGISWRSVEMNAPPISQVSRPTESRFWFMLYRVFVLPGSE